MENIDYKVADINLAEWGNKEISIAEKEMPGLMALREEYINIKPLQLPSLSHCGYLLLSLKSHNSSDFLLLLNTFHSDCDIIISKIIFFNK